MSPISIAALQVIITIGIFGTVDIELTHDKDILKVSQHQPREQFGKTISPGDAYALWRQCRWKMKHDAIVSETEAAIPGLPDQIARVGLTLRFFRRTFGAVLQANPDLFQSSPTPVVAASRSPPPLALADISPMEIIDCIYYDHSGNRINPRSYPSTYPAIVLGIDASAEVLTVFYISDGLIADDEQEAWSLGRVPIRHAAPAAESVKERCKRKGTASARLMGALFEKSAQWGGELERFASWWLAEATGSHHKVATAKEYIMALPLGES